MPHSSSSSVPRLLTRAGLALGLAVAGQAVFLATAGAANLTVTSTADVATNFGACGNTAQTTSSGSLREAICAANNAGAASSTITVAAGTYTLANGELQMGKVAGSNITLNGAGAGITIINGNNASRVFNLDPNLVGNVTTSISGVTITNGSDSTFGGAGIIAGSTAQPTGAPLDVLTVSNSTITNNHASGGSNPGGGIQFSGGNLTITNSTISNNTVNGAEGSGVKYRAEGTGPGEGLTISGTTFSGNNGNPGSVKAGGALETEITRGSPAVSNISNSRFIGNTVTASGAGTPVGGAIWAPSGVVNVTESTFTGNSVTGGTTPTGGAILVSGATVNLHYNRFTGNTGATGQAVAQSAGSVDATDNWWGCNTGPGTAGCDSVAGTVTVSPRLVLTATASPATVVGPNATSTITAALTQDSVGSAIGASNLDAFAGLPIGFSDPLPSGATLGASSANLSSGSTSTSYNSQNSSGPGHVLATLDNGTATATVTVNRAPGITSANSANFTVGTAGSFTVTTTGYPNATITKTGTVPPGMTFTDNGNGTATLSGTPTAGGSYPLSLTASNGVNPNATQTLTVTVTQAPVFTSGNTANFTAGTAGSFSITTTPTAYPTPVTITKTGTLPTGLTFTDNGNGTATLAGTPAAGTGGSYSINLTASNGVNPNGTQTLTINVNEAPAVTTNPANQTVNSGASVSFTAAASGFPAPTVQWQRSTDGGTSFANIAGATSTTYTFTAASADNGNKYRAVFTNSAGSATSTAATLTVNTAPSISSANTTTFSVGTAGSFTVTTTGFPNPTLTTTGTLPAWLSFTDNHNGTATLAGTPPTGSGGQYNFTINANNGTPPSDSQAFTLTVNEKASITSADHATFQAGTAGNFLVTTSAGFPVATTLTKTGTLPSGVSFTDNDNGTASIAGTPAAGTAGSYPITINATNAAGTSSQSFTLTVTESPVITSADHATFVAGSAGSFTVTTSGGAGSVTLTKTGTLPTGVSFADNGDGTATIAGTPAAGTGGTYSITITASDGVNTDDTQTFTLTVNQPPRITSADHDTFTLGTAGSFTVTTAPGVPATTTLTKTGTLPAGVSFTDNGDGTATIAGTPTAAGSFPITIKASNGVGPDDTQSFTLTVNQAPGFTSTDHATFAAGAAGSFTVTTSPAADTITETGSLPSGVSFTDNGDGTATLAGTPAAGTGGTYALSLKASNATGSSTQSFTLTVNELAAFTSADHATFVVGTAGSFTVTTAAGYPTATTITKTGTLPAGVSFTDNGDGTATLAGTPAAGSAGSYPLTITAANAAGNRQQSFTLTVVPANASPVITSADHTTFTVGSAGSFTVTTTAGYPTATTITKTGALPSGVSFTDNHDGTATLAGTPAAGTAGSYPITITASNGASPDATQSFTLTVVPANASPVITSADHTTFTVGSAGSFAVTTTAGYPTATTLSKTGTLPVGVSFTDNGDGTATIAGTPAAGSAGSYPITITASNGASPDATQSFTLTVVPANASPVITSADHTSFTFGSAGSFTVTTTAGYPTATTLTETGALPAGVTFTDNHDGTATIAGTPTAAGAFPITIKASNGASTDATQSFTLTVTKKPAISSADHATFTIGSAGSFTVTTTAGYPTATTLSKTGTLPIGVSFTDNGDGTATIAGTPAAGSAGSYPITITAQNTAGSTQQSFTLTVVPATASPVITSADHTSFTFGSAGSFTVTTTAGYPTATTLTETGALPAGVTFTDNHDGTATIAGTPTAAGAFPITIKASNGASTDATQSFTLTVTKKAAISSADHASFVVGSAGNFAVTTTGGYPAATTISETGSLPAGVSFTDNGNGTATLSGTPAAGSAGSYPLTITATNAAGSTQQSFTLTVVPASASPVITSTDHATFTKGSAGSFTVTTAAGYPTATTLTETGALPAGVSFTDNHNGTATIAGTPTAAGVFPITIKASNGASTDATQAFTLTVNAPPVITSANTTTFTSDLAGQSFTVTTAAGYPTATTLTETGALPAGVTFTDNHNGTATIAGTPSVTTDSNFVIVIKASNGISPDASQSFTLKVTKVAAVALPSSKPKADGQLGGVPSKVFVNQVLTVTGSGYKPGAPIEIGWYYSSSGKTTKLTVLAHGYANAAGSFSIRVTVPNNTGAKTVMSAGIGSNGKARYLSADTVVNPPLANALLAGVPLTTIVGNSLTVSGAGYQPGTSIEIGWYLPQTVLGTTVADANGKFRITVKLPNQAGVKALYAAGLGSDGKARYLVAPTLVKCTTTGGTGQPTRPGGGSSTGGAGTNGAGTSGSGTSGSGASHEGGLANTGLANQRVSAASAGALALTGFALMVIGRRRRREED